MTPEKTIEAALERIRARWYEKRPRTFWRDRRGLLEALTWPAAQLHERGVPIKVAQYATMLDGILTGIEEHAESRVAGEYFPAYLMRCVRNHWRHHWEDYYEAGKRLRGTYEKLLARAGARAGTEEVDAAKILAAANALVAAPPRRQPNRANPQLDLFG